MKIRKMSIPPSDKDAIGPLFDQYRDSIFHLCKSIVHEEELAKDLTQETFVSAFRHFDKLRDPSKIKAWLHTIARNLSLTSLKEKKAVAFRDELATPQKKTEEAIEEDEAREAIEKAKEKLSPKHREVFELYDVEKLSHKEIAVRLHIPIGTCRSRLHYARKKVRQYIHDHYQESSFTSDR